MRIAAQPGRRASVRSTSALLKSGPETADRFCMGHDQTSVIDARTTTAGTTTPRSLRRNRRLVVAAAVLAVAAGAVVWVTVGTRPASAGTVASTAPAAPSDAAPSPSAPTSGAPSAGATPSAAAGPATAAAAPAPAPAGWESRTFQGVTFSVPPGAA